MKRNRALPHLCCLLACLAALPCLAQPSEDARDCAKARDPTRCIARQQAQEACKDLFDKDKRLCLQARLAPPDCSGAEHPERCEARQNALRVCRGKSGKERRRCLREQPALARHAPVRQNHTAPR